MRIPASIRSFRFPDDYAPVLKLWERSGPGIHVGRSDSFDEVEKKLTRNPDLFLVAEYQGQIIGAVIGGFDGRRGMIYHLAVDIDVRRHGIGRALLDALEDRLRALGCLRSYLMVRKDNSAAQFYEGQGWQTLDLSIYGKDLG